MNTQYMSVKEVAEHFGVSRWKVYELINSGDLGSTTIGKAIRVSKKDIESFERKNHIKARQKERVSPF